MNLYTSSENQKLLWDTISKVNLFQSIPDKNKWFQSIIGHFYDLYKNKPFNKNDLRNLNKETITFMISKLKQEKQFQPSNHSFENNFNQNSTLSNFNHIQTNKNETHNFIQDEKQHELDNQFQLRQQEYGQLLSKPNAPEIDFRENTQEDKPIENMEELLERQMREREYDIQPISKSEEIKIETIDLGEDKKKVSWSSDIENSKFTSLEEKMESFMLSIKDQLQTLYNEIELLKDVKSKPFENKSTTEEFLEKHFA
jgi:hypothetical protein